MKWCNDIPLVPGKYIVQTESSVLKTIRTLDASLTFDNKGKPHWSFSNQKFKRYLKTTSAKNETI